MCELQGRKAKSRSQSSIGWRDTHAKFAGEAPFILVADSFPLDTLSLFSLPFCPLHAVLQNSVHATVDGLSNLKRVFGLQYCHRVLGPELLVQYCTSINRSCTDWVVDVSIALRFSSLFQAVLKKFFTQLRMPSHNTVAAFLRVLYSSTVCSSIRI